MKKKLNNSVIQIFKYLIILQRKLNKLNFSDKDQIPTTYQMPGQNAIKKTNISQEKELNKQFGSKLALVYQRCIATEGL